MTSKFTRILLAVLIALPIAAFPQAGAAPTTGGTEPLPAAPSATPAGGAANPAVPVLSGTRVGTINVEGAIFASNEGQRDFEALSKKLEPKQNELKNLNDEVEGLKKQLNNEKLTEDARANLVKQLEQKQKSLERSVQDARDEAQNQQNEIAQRILQKMAQVIMKYASEQGYGIIIDVSNPWPQGPVLIAGPSVDITKAVVDAYNLQSGVPAPTKPASKPAATGAKSTAPATGTKPQAPATGQQPPK